MTAQPERSAAYEPTLRVVQGTKRPGLRPGTWIFFTAGVLVVFLGLIFLRTSLDRTAFELKDIERAMSAETARFEELRLEIARLSSPSRIAPLAESIGMVLPDDVDRVTAVGVSRTETDREERWADMKPILTASP